MCFTLVVLFCSWKSSESEGIGMLKVFKERVDDAMEFHIIIITVDIFDKIIYTPIISYHYRII